MRQAMEASVVAIDATTVFVATEERIVAFRRVGLPPGWWRRLRLPEVNRRVAGLIATQGVPAATPFAAVPVLAWPADLPCP